MFVDDFRDRLRKALDQESYKLKHQLLVEMVKRNIPLKYIASLSGLPEEYVEYVIRANDLVYHPVLFRPQKRMDLVDDSGVDCRSQDHA